MLSFEESTNSGRWEEEKVWGGQENVLGGTMCVKVWENRLANSKNWEFPYFQKGCRDSGRDDHRGPCNPRGGTGLVLQAVRSHGRALNTGLKSLYLSFRTITPWRRDWIQTMLEVRTGVGVLMHWCREDRWEAYTVVETEWPYIVQILKIQKQQTELNESGVVKDRLKVKDDACGSGKATG